MTLLFATKTDSRLEPVHCIRTYVHTKIRGDRLTPEANARIVRLTDDTAMTRGETDEKYPMN